MRPLLTISDREAKVAVLDGGAYGLSPYRRMSFAASPDAVEAGSKAIVEACKALVKQLVTWENIHG